MTNVLSAVVRGAGNMLLLSLMLLAAAFIHLLLCPLLVFGWGPFGGMGVAGAAVSTLCANAVAAAVLSFTCCAGRRHPPEPLALAPAPGLMGDILRVGLPASLSPVISNGSIAIATAFVGSFGTAALAGYGIAARLEYILVPSPSASGPRLRPWSRPTWAPASRRARCAPPGSAARRRGDHRRHRTVGGDRAVAVDEPVHQGPRRASFGGSYLNIVGACYGLFGLGLALFFASQGAGRMPWPLIGSIARLVIIAVGGWLCVHLLHSRRAGSSSSSRSASRSMA